MECPSCKNEVKGNWCPTCKKPVSSGAMKAPTTGPAKGGVGVVAKTGGSQFSNSAALNQKGSGPVKKDKTIDGFDASNAKQSKYSSHLMSKDRASDLGNTTRSKRWTFAENIAILVLFAASIVGLIAFMLPFMSGAYGTTLDGTVTGMGLFGFEWTAHGAAANPTGTMALLAFVLGIVLVLFTLLKAVAIAVPSLSFMHKTPVAIAHAAVAALFALFAILTFLMLSSFLAAGGSDAILPSNKDAGMGAMLMLVFGIVSIVVAVLAVLSRIKLNAQQQSFAGVGKSTNIEKPM